MYKQYWIAGDMLKALKVMDLSETKRFKLQHTIYRLKLLILKNDGRNEADFAQVCPQTDMEQLLDMFYKLAESPGDDILHDQLSERLTAVLAMVEDNSPRLWNLPQQPTPATSHQSL